MYLVALGFGIASLGTFLLGILGKLSLPWLVMPLLIFLLASLGQIWGNRLNLKRFLNQVKKDRWKLTFLVLLVALGLVYSLRVLVPETSFDALWYHLTLPRLYLQEGRVRFFPGGLLYYSAMPQAMEMIYLLGLAFQGQVLARSFHWLFGVLSALVTYQLARRFTSLKWALTAALIFYSQLTVGWLSSAAYVDLTRTFLETSALMALLSWYDSKEKKWLLVAGGLLGIATSVKLLSLGSAAIVLGLVIWQSRLKTRLSNLIVFTFPIVAVLAPWLIYGWRQTGEWFYPFLSENFQNTQTLGRGMTQWFLSRTPRALLRSVWRMAFTQGDILSPVFLIGLPFLFVSKIYKKRSVRVLGAYVALNFLLWFLTPVNYNRFLLPITPVLAVLLVTAFTRQTRLIRTVFLGAVFGVALLHLGVAGFLDYRVVSYIRGGLDKQAYLNHYLKSDLGNFGGASEFLADKGNQKILVVGGHNQFYLPVPFDHESWAGPPESYVRVLVKDKDLPAPFYGWPKVFEDKDFGVTIYERAQDEN